MKWFRIFCAAAAISLLSCSNPTAPRLPESEEEEEKPDPDDGEKNGFLPTSPDDGILPVSVTFLV
jgi:hypothetical protein